MTRKRRTYTNDFKAEAVNLLKNHGYKKASEELGIAKSTLCDWSKVISDDEDLDSNTDWEALAKKLRKENQYLLEINKVLKKSTAIFSQSEIPLFK